MSEECVRLIVNRACCGLFLCLCSALSCFCFDLLCVAWCVSCLFNFNLPLFLFPCFSFFRGSFFFCSEFVFVVGACLRLSGRSAWECTGARECVLVGGCSGFVGLIFGHGLEHARFIRSWLSRCFFEGVRARAGARAGCTLLVACCARCWSVICGVVLTGG